MEDVSEQQLFFMRRAITLGAQGKITAPPNPWVGCVIVKYGKIIGEGFHAYAGGPHAEEVAIRNALESVEGSEVYVSLEPCSHYGTRPPCVHLLIQHKIAKVFIALVDPDARVAGKGIEILKKAGILVHVGLVKEEAFISLKSYLHQRTYSTPWILLKSAASIDGQVADRYNRSQWITCPEARQDVGKLRAESQAIIIGSGTALSDNPKLTARLSSGELYSRQPLRVVLDTLGKVSPQASIFNNEAPTLYVTTTRCPDEHIKIIESLGIEILITQPTHLGVDLHQVNDYLAAKKILQVLVEGGATLHTAFLKEGLAHALVLYLGPKILGNQNKPLFADLNWALDSARTLLPQSAQFLGNSLKILWELSPVSENA
ncbi:bifunctional diaminohydroxyphosphoribosylaminopyrimidine deaminase/5-amino-6-(5-phosphoribosylamino)uracil reductase RibD [Candidatus Chlamydia sanziniae]|uniref:Riboflavin biosynthesis protein RibD n=1 Tax=Candidatus Chlamydia sanziniae TaxID=1806891 RepID=A0A1A9HVE5_9CHLA|nr:bifunctional diaminohydroxyphosphoribosylaminopyrimidine deaminase/5-amino-6-(5-phosphoribosylamino)uracil reductase RibD [Candidatus Chlamydia sanziniae]ANH78667.1 Diaminohydroxyphosphoribosylaminopyrimidine deaminase [Candidatus Chlamydia sanziniae]